MLETSINPKPNVVIGEGTDPSLIADTEALAYTLHELGVSEEGINKATFYIDPKSRFLNFGTHYPNWLGRQRFRGNDDLQQAEGDIVRLSSVMKGKQRTPEEMNRTLVHEMEHLAQQDRHDRKLHEGHVAIWGLAAVGAIVGNRLGRRKLTKTVGTLAGSYAGYTLGYLLAPHERQARQRARTVETHAIKHI